MGVPLRCRWARFRRRRVPGAVSAGAVAVALFAAFLVFVNLRFRPVLEALAESSAVNRLATLISAAVSRCVAQQGLGYEDLVRAETDGEGRITALKSSLSATSALRAAVAETVEQQLAGLQEERFGVPIGSLTSWAFLSGRGPEIRARVLSAGDVQVELRHEFSEAGINQTFHRIFMDVTVTVQLLLPGRRLPVSLTSPVCVAETVIVGQVPSAYLNLNGDG